MENGTSVSQRIQMDNEVLKIDMTIDEPGCGGYTKGEHVTGRFSVNDAYLLSYSLSSSLAPNVFSGTTDVANGTFDFATAGGSACGSISLVAYEQTIWNSDYTGNYVSVSEVVCLK